MTNKGIPGQVQPDEFKNGLSEPGSTSTRIAGSLGDLGVFVAGQHAGQPHRRPRPDDQRLRKRSSVVAHSACCCASADTPGVTPSPARRRGFSIRSPELGAKPLVVASEGERIAISYGLAASAQALRAGQSATLAEDPAYKEAVAALGDTPISGFVDGPAALALIQNMIPPGEEEGFEEARPYLEKIAYAAIGAGSSGDLTTAKMIVGLAK